MAKSVVGVDVINKKIAAIAKATDDKTAAQALRSAMKPMMKEAQKNAPKGDEGHMVYSGKGKTGRFVAPGFLRKNITLKKMRGVIGYTLKARKEAWYGILHEFGFKGRGGDPWLGPAYNSEKDNVVGNFKRDMVKIIDRKVKRIKKTHL